MNKRVLKTSHKAAIANSHFKERHPSCVVRTKGNNSVRISSHNTSILSSVYNLSTGPNTGPGQPHPTGMNRLNTYTILSQTNRKTHVIYMVLYHLHTRPPTSCKRDLVPLPTLILIMVLCYIYIASLMNCIQPDDGHSSNGLNM